MEQLPQNDARRSLGGLLSAVVPELRRWVQRHRRVERLGGESVADIVQSVCREALAARTKFEDQGEGQFRAWMRTMTERKLADRARHWSAARREVSRRRELDSDGLEPASGEGSPEELASRRDLLEHVLRAIAHLPPDQAAVLRLQVVEELSTAEIASRLDKSEGAVRILRCRGLAALGRFLDHAESDAAGRRAR